MKVSVSTKLSLLRNEKEKDRQMEDNTILSGKSREGMRVDEECKKNVLCLYWMKVCWKMHHNEQEHPYLISNNAKFMPMQLRLPTLNGI